MTRLRDRLTEHVTEGNVEHVSSSYPGILASIPLTSLLNRSYRLESPEALGKRKKKFGGVGVLPPEILIYLVSIWYH